MIELTPELIALEKANPAPQKLYYFTGLGCRPCLTVTPILTELEADYPAVKFFKIDANKALKFTGDMLVWSLPTMIFFKNGQEVARLAGLVKKEKIIECLKKLL